MRPYLAHDAVQARYAIRLSVCIAVFLSHSIVDYVESLNIASDILVENRDFCISTDYVILTQR